MFVLVQKRQYHEPIQLLLWGYSFFSSPSLLLEAICAISRYFWDKAKLLDIFKLSDWWYDVRTDIFTNPLTGKWNGFKTRHFWTPFKYSTHVHLWKKFEKVRILPISTILELDSAESWKSRISVSDLHFSLDLLKWNILITHVVYERCTEKMSRSGIDG